MIFRRLFIILAFALLGLSQAFAKNLIIYGDSFDPPTLAQENHIRTLANHPDTQVLLMVKTYGEHFHHSATERALYLSSALKDLGSKVRIIFQGYSKFGNVPVVLSALEAPEYDQVFYAADSELSPIPAFSSAELRKALSALPFDADENLDGFKEVISEPVRHILASERYLRSRPIEEKAFEQEPFKRRFAELKNKLAAQFPEYAETILKVERPAFTPYTSRLAEDEVIVRSLIDAVVAQYSLDQVDTSTEPTRNPFAGSLLFFKAMGQIRPEYLLFSPHKFNEATNMPVGFSGEAEALKTLLFSYKTMPTATTAQRYQLASGEYSKQRKAFHQEIIREFEAKFPAALNGEYQATFLAGPPGSGKSTVLKMLMQAKRSGVPVLSIDDFRAKIIQKDFPNAQPSEAVAVGGKTHDEASYINGSIWSVLNSQNKSFIVDGTMRATEYFSWLFAKLKSQGYKINIIYVTAPNEQLMARINERAERELRANTVEHVIKDIEGSEISWQILAPQADLAIHIENPDTATGVPAPMVKLLWKAGQSVDVNQPLLKGCTELLTVL